MNPPSGSALRSAKRRIRSRVRAGRDALAPADRAVLGGRAIRRVLDLPELAAATTVMAFWSFGSELSTEPLIDALLERGARVALPRIVEGDLVPLAYRAGDPTTPTTFGAREPAAEAERVPPAAIDVVVVPGVAFDRRGGRIGYGGGFYDRFLGSKAPHAFRVGVGFGAQLLDEELPLGRGDVRMHAVVTDREVVRAGAGDRAGRG